MKMTIDEAMAIIRKEYLCVDRDCDIDRSCGKCDLMMPSKEPILEAYKMAIKALEQMPTKEEEALLQKWRDNRGISMEEFEDAMNTLDQEPCEDAISRAEAVRVASGYCHPANVAKELAKLPPVNPQGPKTETWSIKDVTDTFKKHGLIREQEPKTGHWIRVTDKTGHLVWECDKCSWQQRFNTNFCPDCGSHNEGD